jgi:hypothetical protein
MPHGGAGRLALGRVGLKRFLYTKGSSRETLKQSTNFIACRAKLVPHR